MPHKLSHPIHHSPLHQLNLKQPPFSLRPTVLSRATKQAFAHLQLRAGHWHKTNTEGWGSPATAEHSGPESPGTYQGRRTPASS